MSQSQPLETTIALHGARLTNIEASVSDLTELVKVNSQSLLRATSLIKGVGFTIGLLWSLVEFVPEVVEMFQ